MGYYQATNDTCSNGYPIWKRVVGVCEANYLYRKGGYWYASNVPCEIGPGIRSRKQSENPFNLNWYYGEKGAWKADTIRVLRKKAKSGLFSTCILLW